MVFREKKRDEFDLGEDGGEIPAAPCPPNAEAGTTLLEDCFHMVNGDRENGTDGFLVVPSCCSIRTDAEDEFDALMLILVLVALPFSTMTKPLLLSSECWDESFRRWCMVL